MFLKKFLSSQGSNILLTVCKDGICRIWAATNPEEPHNLYICTVVDPEQSLVTLPSSEEERICHGNPDCFSPIHWIHPREFLISLKLAIDSFDSENEPAHIGTGLKKLKDLANDTPDLLYQIQKDGSMVIWGIRVTILIKKYLNIIHKFKKFVDNKFIIIRMSIVDQDVFQKFSFYFVRLRRFHHLMQIIFMEAHMYFMIMQVQILRAVIILI